MIRIFNTTTWETVTLDTDEFELEKLGYDIETQARINPVYETYEMDNVHLSILKTLLQSTAKRARKPANKRKGGRS
jgi:hypothetical protein